MKKIIYALGYFDGVHLGHKALLTACRNLADQTASECGAVTFSDHPLRCVAGQTVPLINTHSDRENLLKSGGNQVLWLPFTTELMQMPWRDFLDMLIKEHSAAGFVCGWDFRFGRGGAGTAQLLEGYCKERSIPCTLVEQVTMDGLRVSSTHIRALLEQGDMEQAAKCLGHSHILSGEVCHGKALGRTIGVPTANLFYPEELVKLPYGVYAARVTTESGVYRAVTNVGRRPTVNGEDVTVESYLIGFAGDLYGKQIQVEFLRYLRPEQKFSDLNALRQQIEDDIKNCKK